MTAVDFPRRLTVAFALIHLFAASLAGAALVSGRASSQAAQRVIEREASDLVAVERLRASVHEQALATRGYLLTGNRLLLEERIAAERAVARELGELRRAAAPESLRHLLPLERLIVEHQGVLAPFLGAETETRAPGRGSASGILANYRRIDQALDDFARHQRAQYDAAVRTAAEQRRRNVLALAAVITLGLLLSATVAVVLGRRLSRAYAGETEAKRVAQAAVAARQDLLGTVAHDLRSPLSAILVRSQAMARSSPAGSPLHEHGAFLQRVARRMQFLIGSLLDAASLEAGALTLRSGPVRAQDLLASTRELFEAQAAQRGIGLSFHATDAALELHGDAERLLQVLSNLVGNALKFTPRGGTVRVSCEPAGDALRFCVSDTGPGIAAEDLPRLFDRYWKRDRDGAARGTGLGLYIARDLVERHGGSLRVESRPGAGATFRFDLPRAHARPVLARAPAEPAAAPAR